MKWFSKAKLCDKKSDELNAFMSNSLFLEFEWWA